MAQEDDFSSAFNTDEPEAEMQTEDQVFGLTDDEVTEESQAMPDEQSEAETGSEGSAGDDTEGAAPAVVIAIEPGAEEAPQEAAEDMPTDPKDMQRMKSWEGRLKAREAELKAREEAMGKAPADEPGEMPAQEAAEPGVTEAVEDAVEAVSNGDLSIDEAMRGLADTFGEDFTKMLGVLIEQKATEIAGRTADDRFGKVKGELDGLVNEIVSDKASSHAESIADAHPDFMDVAGSPEFKSYIDNLDETQQAKAMQVIEGGTARQIVKLLDTYKSTMKKVDPPQEDPAMDAAEGVRSKGIKIPEKPAVSDDFAEAFDQF